MIRSSLMALLTFCVVPAFASIFPDMEGIESVKEVPTGTPGLYKFIVTESESGHSQAAAYVNPKLEDLYVRTIAEYEPLQKTIKKIYADYGCVGASSPEDADNELCGHLNELGVSNTVLWSYGRGGWADAGAMKKSFISFTQDGSGGFTDVVLEVTTLIDVSAITWEAPVSFEVTIDMREHRQIPLASDLNQ